MNGFILTIGKHEYFYKTDATNKTDKIARAFIHKIGDHRNRPAALIEKACNDPATLRDTKYRMDKATLDKIVTDRGYTYYKICGKGFSFGYPEDDFRNDVVVF